MGSLYEILFIYVTWGYVYHCFTLLPWPGVPLTHRENLTSDNPKTPSSVANVFIKLSWSQYWIWSFSASKALSLFFFYGIKLRAESCVWYYIFPSRKVHSFQGSLCPIQIHIHYTIFSQHLLSILFSTLITFTNLMFKLFFICVLK